MAKKENKDQLLLFPLNEISKQKPPALESWAACVKRIKRIKNPDDDKSQIVFFTYKDWNLMYWLVCLAYPGWSQVLPALIAWHCPGIQAGIPCLVLDNWIQPSGDRPGLARLVCLHRPGIAASLLLLDPCLKIYAFDPFPIIPLSFHRRQGKESKAIIDHRRLAKQIILSIIEGRAGLE